MGPRTAVLLLLLLLHLAQAHRTHDNRHLSREVRPRRHDSEERASGRRWTTSRNSPYQKIVSSYEQEVPGGQDNEPEDEDQAKAKSHKRKQWRTGAPSHDQITSETSSAGESEKAEHDHEFRSESSDHSEPVSEAPRKSSVPARRRVTTSHPQETSSDDHLEISTTNPKRRRRPPSTSTTTTTSSPQTMSDKLYNHFQPLDQNVPQDDIIPFLDFGRKLSPVLPTPSGANSIESKSTVSKLRSRSHHEDKESNSSDEEMLQEDMDVTVVKKAIERNSVPRTKLRVREQGISDYYRKRAPTQVRTTENLISTSDSSTASSISGSKNTVVLKKGIRHQAHHDQLVKAQERGSSDISLHQPTNVEILPEKRAELLTRPIERTAALVEESHNSPLTAESSLVKTVIKEVPTTKRSTELVVTTEGETKNQSTSTAPTTTAEYVESSSLSPSTIGDKLTIKTNRTPTNNTQEKTNPKILSTAVVTSVSVEGSDQEDETTSVLESSDNVKNKTSIKDSRRDYLNTTATPESNSSISVLPVQNAFISRNLSNSFQNNSLKNSTSVEPKNTPLRNDTSLRSRDIYRPKAIPSSLNIHHLPRQILFNITRKPIVPSSTPLIVLNSTDKQDTITTSPKTFPATESSTNSAKSTTVAQTSTPTATLKSSNLSPIVPVGGTLPHEMPQQTTKTDNAMSEDGLDKRISNSTSIATPKQYSLAESKDKYNTTRVNETQPSIVAEADQPLISVETESIPPPNYDEPVENLTFVPAAPEEDSEDQFPIYFTTLPASSVPVVDTRPRQTTGTEAAVVRDHRNMTTTRAGVGGGTDWVKVGAVDKEVEVVYPETLGVGAYLLAGLGVVPIILGALVGARFILAHNRKKVLDESEYSSEYNRSPLGTSTASPLPTKLPRIPTHVGWSETEKSAPPIAPLTSPVPGAVRWEFPREKLRLQTLLGQGNFGQVWKAEADDISGHEGLTRLVAVKTVKESANTREREDLLRELGIMQELGSHPNVVTLLGCCTEKEPIYLIMEYVMYGKLLSFLRDYRTRAHYYNFSDASDALTSRDLTVFAYCVARGMDYLSNKSIIHRDLAARNVLVDHNKLCKIADFGMSRNVRDTGQIYEQRQSKGALPIRWMAPESLHFSLFTHKTDVWSFGILMWEIVTLGSTPYSTMGAREVMRRVRDGYRLDRPSHCRHELFRVIAQCWHSEPSRRPTFAELKAELAQLLSDKELNGGYVDLESYADEMRRDSLHRHH